MTSKSSSVHTDLESEGTWAGYSRTWGTAWDRPRGNRPSVSHRRSGAASDPIGIGIQDGRVPRALPAKSHRALAVSGPVTGTPWPPAKTVGSSPASVMIDSLATDRFT